MKRRNFFKTMLGLAVAPLVTYLPEAKAAGETISLDAIKRMTAALSKNGVKGPFVAHVHPDAVADIRALPGFVDIAQYGRGTKYKHREIGMVDSVRFIQTRSLS